MNESFFKTIDLVLVSSHLSVTLGKRYTYKNMLYPNFGLWQKCDAELSNILHPFSSIIVFFRRDFGKSFHTCTNRGNCQKSKLFPWPKTTSWHSPTSYVSIGKSTLLIEVTCFWRNLLATTSNRKTLKGEHQQLSNEFFKRQQAERDFWRSLSLPSFFLFDYWYAHNWKAPYYKAKEWRKSKEENASSATQLCLELSMLSAVYNLLYSHRPSCLSSLYLMRENGVRKFVPYRWDDVSCDVNARLYGSLGKEEGRREFFDIEFFEEWEKKERKRKAKGGLHFSGSYYSFMVLYL